MNLRTPTLCAIAVTAAAILIVAAPGEAERTTIAATTSTTTSTTLPPATTSTTSTTTTTTTSTTTTTTVAVATPPVPYRYPHWIELAVTIGWPNDPDVLHVLDTVIHRESNGRPDAWNQNDPMTGSYGITQINGFWCSPTQYNPDGFMQAQGILTTCTDLFDPATNLRAALIIWTRQGGFDAWSTV